MSVLHHEEILETCFETAVEEFCTSNKLTPEMFAEIEQHEGVQIALEKRHCKSLKICYNKAYPSNIHFSPLKT